MTDSLLAAMKAAVEEMGDAQPMAEFTTESGDWVIMPPPGGDPAKRRVDLVQMLMTATILGANDIRLGMDAVGRVLEPGEEPTVRPSEDPRSVEQLVIYLFERGVMTEVAFHPYHRDDAGTVIWDERRTMDATLGPGGNMSELVDRFYDMAMAVKQLGDDNLGARRRDELVASEMQSRGFFLVRMGG